MSKRYLGGDIYFEQKETSQEFSEEGDGGGGGSSTLSGLTDVDISNPTDGQTLVYNATSGKWENGVGGSDMFVTLGTINAATVPMSYVDEDQAWEAAIDSDITVPATGAAGRNLVLKIDGQSYSVDILTPSTPIPIDEEELAECYLNIDPGTPASLSLLVAALNEPIITDLSVELYTLTPELGVFFSSANPK